MQTTKRGTSPMHGCRLKMYFVCWGIIQYESVRGLTNILPIRTSLVVSAFLRICYIFYYNMYILMCVYIYIYIIYIYIITHFLYHYHLLLLTVLTHHSRVPHSQVVVITKRHFVDVLNSPSSHWYPASLRMSWGLSPWRTGHPWSAIPAPCQRVSLVASATNQRINISFGF